MSGPTHQQAAQPSKSGGAPVRPRPSPSRAEAARPAGHAFSSLPVQAKLEVGAPDDAYEQEADRVAEQVMRSPAPALDGGAQAAPPKIQRMCAGCEEEEKAQMAPDPDANVEGAEPALDLDAQVAALRGSGAPLPEGLRATLEARLGHDFSRVRIHAGHRAAQAARSIGARAFTVGHEIAFAAGEYDPDSAQGQRLLAHELTHVVQQGGGSDGPHKLERSAPAPAPARKRREDDEEASG